MTMDCPRSLLRLNTTPMCPSVPKTPCRRLDKGDRERSRGTGGAGVRRMHQAATTLTNSTGQLNQTGLQKCRSVGKLSPDHFSIALQVNKDLGKMPHWNLIGVVIIQF